jgi:hypothetical protein
VEVEAGILDLRTGDESLLQVGAGAQVAGLDLDGGVAASRFVVAVLDDFEQVAVELEGDAFAEVIDINHNVDFLFCCGFTRAAGLYHRKAGRMKDESGKTGEWIILKANRQVSPPRVCGPAQAKYNESTEFSLGFSQ